MKNLIIDKTITDKTDGSAVDMYFRDVAGIKLISLSYEEEGDLAKRIREGDQVALEKLVSANLRFVISVAKQYQNQGMQLPDLINEGNIGLIKAAERFDETKGYKFISYAVWWIRQSILQALAEQSRIVRLPLNKVGDLTKLNKILGILEQELERQPLPEDIANHIDLPESMIQQMMELAAKHISIDAPISSDKGEDDASMIDLIEQEGDDNFIPDANLDKESIAFKVKQFLIILDQREADIVTLFFGLNGQMTLDEIADKFDLSPERVRQIKEKALRKLRKESNVLREFLS